MSLFNVISDKLTTMGVQDFVSIVAALIAILAALYARWSARATERANEITIHAERLRIFKTIRNFQHQIEKYGLEYPDAAQSELIQGAELAEFFFSPAVAKPLAQFVEQSQTHLNARAGALVQDSLGQPILPPGARARLSESHRQLLDEVKRILNKMKSDLRLTEY